MSREMHRRLMEEIGTLPDDLHQLAISTLFIADWIAGPGANPKDLREAEELEEALTLDVL